MTGRSGIAALGGAALGRTLLCGAVGLGAAALSFRDSYVSIFWKNAPSRALAMASRDGRALAREADKQALRTDAQPDFRAIGAMARNALKSEPLRSNAMRVVGMSREAAGDKAGSAVNFRLAAELSRRDFLSQLWAIEDAVGKADVAGALRHYDISLRTNPSSQSILFPLMAGAISEPDIRAQFRVFLKTRPTWLLPFLDYASQSGPDPQALATFLVANPDALDQKSAHISSHLLSRLADSGQTEVALRYMRSLDSNADKIVRDANVNTVTTNVALQPLTWVAENGGAVSALLGQDGNSIHVYAGAGGSGVALRRFFYLAPGSYRLTETRNIMAAGGQAEANWTIKCLRNGSYFELWRSEHGAIAGRPQAEWTFTLPADCRNQYFSLSISGGGDAQPLDYAITGFHLQSIGDRPSS